MLEYIRISGFAFCDSLLHMWQKYMNECFGAQDMILRAL